MFLREKNGFYAGQVREFPAPVGNELLRLGRAENPYAETQPRPHLGALAAAPGAQAPSAPPQATPVRAKKGRK